jgi:hypothetical protein
VITVSSRDNAALFGIGLVALGILARRKFNSASMWQNIA